jgi:hypothetical protein
MDIMKDAMERLDIKHSGRGRETRSGVGDDNESGSSDSDDSGRERRQRAARNANWRRDREAAMAPPPEGALPPGNLDTMELQNIPVPDTTKYLPLDFLGRLVAMF